MTTNLKGTDVVVVGLGAAGGVAVLPLTRAGLDVIGLEAGGWLTPADFAPDEIRNNVRDWPQSVQKANHEVPTHRRSEGAAYSPRPQFHPMMNAVGGASLHYWAQSWRLNPWDFKVVSATTARYGAHRLPKGSTVEDWPFGLDELEPYYDHVEYEVGVSGKAGNIKGKLDPAGNIYEGERAREYPMPALRGTEYTDMMGSVGRKMGLHTFAGPAAITSQPYEGRSGCMYHGWCDRGGCPVRAKSSTAVSTIPKAQATGRLKVVPYAHVVAIESDGEGRVTGVTYLKDGEVYFQPAKAVLLGSYVYENVRLLLMSKSKAHPNGLGNGTGQVGRHYFSHNHLSGLTALFPHDINNWYGLQGQGVGADNWADDNWDHKDVDFIGGANMYVYSARRPIGGASMGTFGHTKSWGSDWKAFMVKNIDRTNTAYLQKTTLPYEDNYLDLDPVVKDPLGHPVTRITADFKANEAKVAEMAWAKMEAWYREAGAIAVEKVPLGTMGPTTHAYGGTRMGDNPKTNVVDRWGFSHEAANLGVLGGSVMGTSGSRNPTLTLQALAWRTAQHLADTWGNRTA